ncbi:kinase-like domain-containing protein [Hyaloraphidium curvatum]|nr:kinase-like domain-containing protein [Hyaloraphidium curvatum]
MLAERRPGGVPERAASAIWGPPQPPRPQPPRPPPAPALSPASPHSSPATPHSSAGSSAGCAACSANRSSTFDEGRARRRDFKVLRALGAGTSGSVRAAVCRSTGAGVAVKSYAKAPPEARSVGPPGPSGSRGRGGAGCDPAALRRRVAAIADLRHPNLLEVYEFFETSQSCYTVMELAQGGDLDSYQSLMGKLPERDIGSILHGILSGLAYLHSRGIAHRDVKPGNVLLRTRDDPSSVVLADFDGSFVSGPGEDAPGMRILVGTPYFLAPELVSGKDYGPEVDVYSAGCIAFLLTCGRTPFEDSSSFAELYSRISRGGWTFPSTARISRPLEDLIRSMLRTDPARRPSASAALAHTFFALGSRRRSASGVRVRFDERTGELFPDEGGTAPGGTGWAESGAEAVELALGKRAAVVRARQVVLGREAASV